MLEYEYSPASGESAGERKRRSDRNRYMEISALNWLNRIAAAIATLDDDEGCSESDEAALADPEELPIVHQWGGSNDHRACDTEGLSDDDASESQYLEPWTWMPEPEEPSDDECEPEVMATLADSAEEPTVQQRGGADSEELQAAQQCQWGGGGISEDSQASDPVMSSLIELLAMLLRALWFMIWLVAEIIRGIYLMQRAQQSKRLER